MLSEEESEKIEDLVKECSADLGLIITKDDPIFMVYLMLLRIREEQEDSHRIFMESLETSFQDIFQKVTSDSFDVANKIFEKSDEVILNKLDVTSNTWTDKFINKVKDAVMSITLSSHQIREARKLYFISMATSVVSLICSLVLLLVVIFK